MPAIPINYDPPMTRYLVEGAGVFRDEPVTIVDVGARSGFNAEWKVFGKALKVICFEPDAEECARLNADAPPNVVYLPLAVGGRSELATFYVAKLNYSSGLYRTNMEYFSRLLNRDNGVTVGEERMQVTTLDDALAVHGIDSVDFIKLDVEGAELEVLQGGENYVTKPGLIGILSEFRFQEEINGCPIFWQLDSHVRRYGFRLYGMSFYNQSRHVLPYEGLMDYRLPNGERFFAYTQHGQIMDGDALYFRDLLIPANAAIRATATVTQLLKTAAFLEIYYLNDCAGELIMANREQLEPHVNCEQLLDLLTPSLKGAKLSYKQYIEAYFNPTGEAPPSVLPPEKSPDHVTLPVDQGEKKRVAGNRATQAQPGNPRPSEMDLLRAELDRVYASRSWRMTRPFRLMMQRLRKLTT